MYGFPGMQAFLFLPESKIDNFHLCVSDLRQTSEVFCLKIDNFHLCVSDLRQASEDLRGFQNLGGLLSEN